MVADLSLIKQCHFLIAFPVSRTILVFKQMLLSLSLWVSLAHWRHLQLTGQAIPMGTSQDTSNTPNVLTH